MACCHSNPVLDLPITIGSYPIQDVTPSGYPSTVVDSFTTNNVISQQPSAPQPYEQNNYGVPYPSAPFPFPSDGTLQFLISLNLLITQYHLHFFFSIETDPPTYEDAMHSKDADGNNFKPKYPMFKRNTSYSS